MALAAEVLLIRSLLSFWRGYLEPIHIFGDSSAAKGVMMRQGAGRIKHLTLKTLWVQEFVQKGILIPHKIPREENCADLLTHHWTVAEWTKLGGWLNTCNGDVAWPRGGVRRK